MSGAGARSGSGNQPVPATWRSAKAARSDFFMVIPDASPPFVSRSTSKMAVLLIFLKELAAVGVNHAVMSSLSASCRRAAWAKRALALQSPLTSMPLTV